MPRSSISSFSRRSIGWLGVLLVLLGLAEAALRFPPVVAALPDPEPTLWHSPLVAAKLEYLRAFDATQGIDVLFIGNSTAQAGLDPAAFDRIRGAAPGGPGAFNAALEGLPPVGTALFLDIFLSHVTPQVVVLGVTPQDLNRNSPWAADVTERIRHAPRSVGSARRGVTGRLTHWLLENAQLYRYRFVLHQTLLGNGAQITAPAVYFDERGFDGLASSLADVPPEERDQYLNRAGVLNYAVGGEQLAAFQEIIDTLNNAGISLILVNMPLADDYYRNFDDPTAYDQYVATLQAIADAADIHFVDLERGSGAARFDDTTFADFNHLNQHGAEQVAALLGELYGELPQRLVD